MFELEAKHCHSTAHPGEGKSLSHHLESKVEKFLKDMFTLSIQRDFLMHLHNHMLTMKENYLLLRQFFLFLWPLWETYGDQKNPIIIRYYCCRIGDKD